MPAPYYIVKFEVKPHEGEELTGWKAYYVPSAGLWATFDELNGLVHWYSTTAVSRRFLDVDVEPFPKPKLEGVRIDGTLFRGDLQNHLELFAIDSAGEPAAPTRYDWAPVDLIAGGWRRGRSRTAI